jgi:hypothetical protein
LHDNAAPNNDFVFNENVLAQALINIYGKRYDPLKEIDKGLFRETARIINKAADEGFAKAHFSPEGKFQNQIRYNNAVFSAFKVHRQQNDMAAQLLDKNGKLKPFSQWVKDVQPISEHYNKVWLRTEYNTAVTRAQRAVEWERFEAESDVFQNLEWVRTTSLNPGADHSIYWGTVLPIGDKFWSEHRPGDRWNCKCSLRQTEGEIKQPPKGTQAGSQPQAGLENNPADGKIFSDNNAYQKNAHSGAEEAVKRCLKDNKIADDASKQDKIATLTAVRAIKKTIPEHTGISFESKKFITGKMTLLRRSFGDVYVHAIEIEDIRDWLKNFDDSKMKKWRYRGWAKNRPYPNGHPKYNRANPGAPKHDSDTDYFLYYTVKINKVDYWVNVKMHKTFKEVLYTIEKNKPAGIIRGKPQIKK